jgi:hypothetical protein
VKDQRPIRTVLRRVRRLNRIGSDDPICLYCGCSEIALLRPVTKRFLEAHHFLGAVHDPNRTVLLCRNCHYMATENLLRADVSMLPEPDQLRRAVIMLKALSVHHRMLAETFWQLAISIDESRTKRTHRK